MGNLVALLCISSIGPISLTKMSILYMHAFGYLEGLNEKKNCNSADLLEQ